MVGECEVIPVGRSICGMFTCLCILVLAWTGLEGCAHKVDHYARLNQSIDEQDYEFALKLMDESKASYKDRNAVLFYMENGLVAHFAGRYQESNQSLLKAEARLDELYTRSISKQAASFIFNDNTIPYRGEDFEDTLVNLFMALNYAGLGLIEDALVEARQLDNELNLINSRYADDQKNVYSEDAFIRLLMGVLYEAGDEINDAFISYRRAEEVYRTDYQHNYGVHPPQFLIENLLSAAQALDFDKEMLTIQQMYPSISHPDPDEKRNLAEIFIIHYNGLGPEKVERAWVVPVPEGYIVKVAYPQFEKKNYEIARGVVRLRHLDNGKTYHFSTQLVEDIGSIAIVNLDNHMARIKAKAIARAATKYFIIKVASEEAREQGGDLVGVLVQLAGNITAALTERADVRYWRMLPDEIRIGRALVPAGKYDGEIDFVDSGGGVVITRNIKPFLAGSGEKKFIIQRTIR
ncbi:MAG: hypothetical protein JRI99_09185 [Deltaproteobacteria bacterium]|nr:hypothetical protein [Deltaproteobacteria bacterium]